MSVPPVPKGISASLSKLQWLDKQKIWPKGKRYLWTDAFGVVNLLNLSKELDDPSYFSLAEQVIEDVYKVLGRDKGIRIGEQPDRDGQYYHYLTKWLYALHVMGKFKPKYQEMAVNLVKEIHPHFMVPGHGVFWKMKEDLSAPYPGYGFGALDIYEGYTMYKLIDEKALSSEIAQLGLVINRSYQKFSCTQDLGLGDILWATHFLPEEDWAKFISEKAIKTLDKMWVDKGYFVRDLIWEPDFVLAFGNFGVSLGLQSHHLWPDRVDKMNEFFEKFKSGDKYDREAITHVMQMTSYFPGYFLKDYQPKAPSKSLD